MLLTEKEAREKWCPAVRDGSGGDPVCNRWLDKDGHVVLGSHVNCLASDCMWWRWASRLAELNDGDVVHGSGAHIGYCGIAGKPAP